MGAQVVTAASQAIAPALPSPRPDPRHPTSRKMRTDARSARRSRHFSEVGGASGVNSGDLPGRIVKIVSHGFVEANDHPAHFGACSVTVLVPALGEVTAVEPRRPRFDGETDVGPRDVQVDRLTGWQHERMLTNRPAHADHFEVADDVARGCSGRAEPDHRPFSQRSILDPVLATAPMRSVLAASGGVTAQVPRSSAARSNGGWLNAAPAEQRAHRHATSSPRRACPRDTDERERPSSRVSWSTPTTPCCRANRSRSSR